MGYERGIGNGVAQHRCCLVSWTKKVIDNGYADDKRILALFFCLSAPLSQVLPGIGPRFAGTCIRPVLVERNCSKIVSSRKNCTTSESEQASAFPARTYDNRLAVCHVNSSQLSAASITDVFSSGNIFA